MLAGIASLVDDFAPNSPLSKPPPPCCILDLIKGRDNRTTWKTSTMAYYTTFLLLCLCLTYATADGAADPSQKAGQSLLDRMLSNYDKRVPPQGNNGPDTPVLVRATMFVIDVEKICDYHGTFSAEFYFRQKWNDSRLRFDNIDSKVEKIYVIETEKLWKPDLYFVEEMEGKTHNLIVPNVLMSIESPGIVFYSVRMTATFRCQMDFRKFPLDTQKCTLTAESFGYTSAMVDLEWEGATASDKLAYAHSISAKEFDLTMLEADVQKTIGRASEYIALQAIFTFERKTGIYAWKLFIPSVILILMCWLSFWITKKHVLLRLTLLLTVLYLIVQLGRDIELNYVTPTSYLKGSDVWIGVCDSMVFACLLEYILVCLLGKRNKENQKQEASADFAIGIDVEAKKDTENKEENTKMSSAKSVARNLLREGDLPERIDFVSKVSFPIIFLFFNIVYWSVYCTNNE